MDWIGLLKVISMFSAGLFGALGLVTKYKDSNDKITKWGGVALAGIFISTATSLTLHILETSQAKSRAEEAELLANSTTASLKSILDKSEQAVKQQVDIVQRQESAMTTQLQQIQMQEQQLDELQRLYLGQYNLAGIEISWALQPDVARRANEIYERAPEITDRSQRIYLAQAKELAVKRDENGRLRLFANTRPGEMWYPLDSPPSRAFGDVLRLTRACGLSATLAPGINLVRMNDQAWPCEVSMMGGRVVTIAARPGGVKLSQLKQAEVTFQIADQGNDDSDALPDKIRLRSLDPAVLLDTELRTNWKESVVGSLQRGPGDFEEVTAFVSGPHIVQAKFNSVLFPARN